MKILFKAEKLFLVLGLTIAFSSNDAKASGIYPIATNAGVVLSGMDSGVATSGTNYLVSILAGTNVCVQLVSTSGTLIGPLLTVGVGTSFPQVAFGGGNYLVYWDDNFATSGPYGQIVSGNGNKIGLAFLFGSVGVSAGAPRALAFDGVNFLVIWQGGNSYYGQFATPAGNLSGPAFLINGPTSAKDLRVVFATTNYFL